MRCAPLAALCAAPLLALTPASAAVIQPVSVTASDSFWTYDANNLINGSGLSADGLHDTYWGNMWMSDWNSDTHWLLFDLGQQVSLTGARLWQYAADFGWPWYETDRGVRDFAISISTDGVNFTEVATAELARATVTALPAQLVELDGAARYVRIDTLTNWGNPSWTGLAEVRFTGAVPEASTWAMLIAGFGLVGVSMRRRRAIAA